MGNSTKAHWTSRPPCSGQKNHEKGGTPPAKERDSNINYSMTGNRKMSRHTWFVYMISLRGLYIMFPAKLHRCHSRILRDVKTWSKYEDVSNLWQATIVNFLISRDKFYWNINCISLFL